MFKNTRSSFARLLLGFAVGDALGLPAEGLGRSTILRRWKGELRMRFMFHFGMVSDDTDHLLFTARCLARCPGDPTLFQRALARELRWWFAALPPGIGVATAKAAIKLWLGVPPSKAGVFSAGNGPGMRSIVIGAYFADPQEQRKMTDFVKASTELTHSDPKALWGALALAQTAIHAMRSAGPSTEGDLAWLDSLVSISSDPAWQTVCQSLRHGIRTDLTAREFAETLGLDRSVSGYMLHTVPMALFIWWKHRQDYRAAVSEAVHCGGDTDTLAAFVGGLCGVTSVSEIPEEWSSNLALWPESIATLDRIAASLAESHPIPRRPLWLLYAIRNVAQWCFVLGHLLIRIVQLRLR
jgi:ADP-ribosyl-[dinitrogen reductase] hydrolase